MISQLWAFFLLPVSVLSTHKKERCKTYTHSQTLTSSFFLSLLEIPKVTRCENAMWRKPQTKKEWSDESREGGKKQARDSKASARKQGDKSVIEEGK